MKNVFFTLCLILIYQGSNAENILGFDSVGSEKQRRLESEYDKNINAKEMDEWLKELSKVPHHVGSLATKANADFLASLFNSWGFKVEIEEYHILIPTPKVLELDLISPSEYKASLNEESLTEDPSTYVRENLLPPYNAFSIDGKVEGELVFVNYGMPQD